MKMSDFEGKFMDTTSCWVPPPSPSPRTIFAMLNDTDNDQKTEILDQSDVPRNQSRQRSGDFGERLTSRREFQLPTLEGENIVHSRNVLIISGSSPSTILQSPNMLFPSSSQISMSLVTNNEPQAIVDSGEGHVVTMVDLPPQQVVEDVDGNIFSMQEESKNEDQANDKDVDVNEDKKEEDGHTNANADEHEDNNRGNIYVDRSLMIPKRRKYEHASNMIGATRTSKQQRVIIQMESEEDNPNDGYKWRKYGQKIVRGNPNPRSYYKCTHDRCKVKKHVERGADDVKLVVTTYDGIHNHCIPARRDSGLQNRNGSSQNNTARTGGQLGRPLDARPPFMSLGPQIDMTQLFMTGLSKLRSLPVNKYSGFNQPVHQNDESVDPNLDFMQQIDHFGNHKSGYIHQNDEVINPNLDFLNWNFQSVKPNPTSTPNDQLANQDLSFMS